KIESRADELVIEYTGEVIATSTLHVLAVGINKYKNASYNLNYAQPDASSFVEKLNERSRTIFKSVNKVEIYDEDATKENITTGFKSIDRKSTRLNSSHVKISYAVFCLKKKKHDEIY